MDDYDIYSELFTGDWIMAMTGIGNTKNDYVKFANALEDISSKRRSSGLEIHQTEHKTDSLVPPKQAKMFEIPPSKKRVKLADSEGMICGSSIIPYPPGIL